MKLRTFTASDMPSALKQIKEALGPDAVILGSQKEPGRSGVRVTAAVDADSKQTPLEDFKETIELAKRRNEQREWQRRLANIMEFHRLPEHIIERMKRVSEKMDLSPLLTLQKLTSNSSKNIVEAKLIGNILAHSFSFHPLHISEAGKRICLVGPMGAGKTLAIAKLATQLKMQGHKVAVITMDNERAGGLEQLSKYMDILKLETHTAHSKQELLAAMKPIPLDHITLIDTPGMNVMDAAAVDALLEMINISNIEPILVIPAGYDSEESIEIVRSFSSAKVKRLMITRMDAARRYGNVIAAAYEGGLAFSHFTDSPQVVDSCHPLSDQDLATFLLQHKAQRAQPS